MTDNITITNYDVLLDAPPIASSKQQPAPFSLAQHSDHVGNKRLEVFLSMHQEDYTKALNAGNVDHCIILVGKIIQTVCQQCVPRGRFLVQTSSITSNHEKQWTVVMETEAEKVLHQVLRGEQEVLLPDAAVSSAAVGKGECDASDGQKRRRRSSLLRRSASESMVEIFLDKKKVTRSSDQFGTYQEEPSWKPSTTMNRMDILLTHNRDALDPNSQNVGNNRLHILIAMKSPKYKDASVDQKGSILDDIIQTVHVFWRGSFLVAQETTGSYVKLSKEEARHAMRCILDKRTGHVQKSARHSAPTLGNVSNFLPDPQADMSSFYSAAVNSLRRQKIRQNKTRHRFPNVVVGGSNDPKKDKFTPFPLGGQTLTPRGGTDGGGGLNRAAEKPRKRESTILGKIDISAMEQLVSDFDETGCNDTDEPLPPSCSNQFGSRYSPPPGPQVEPSSSSILLPGEKKLTGRDSLCN